MKFRTTGAVLLALAGCAKQAAAPPPPPVASSTPAAEPIAFAVTRAELTQGGWLKGTVTGGIGSLTLDGKPVPVAPDGGFFVAFDRDAGPRATLAGLADGRSETLVLPIAPRAWQIERVPIGPRPGAIPSEEFQRIRAGELARIAVARAKDTGAQGWRQDFVRPAKGRISGRFGAQRIYRGIPGSYHSGIDIAPGYGTPFVAPADGVVILAAASPFTLEGKLLMIDHGAGLNSAFLHCSELLVSEGDPVRQGQIIGRVGATGRATGPHLHWSLKWREARLDPILFTGPMG